MFARELIWMCANCSREECGCLDFASFSGSETRDAWLLLFICSPSVNSGPQCRAAGRRTTTTATTTAAPLAETKIRPSIAAVLKTPPPRPLPTSCYNLEVSSSFQVNVTGSRLVMTLPKYVRLQQSDTEQESVGCVWVALIWSKDPPSATSPTHDNTAIATNGHQHLLDSWCKHSCRKPFLLASLLLSSGEATGSPHQDITASSLTFPSVRLLSYSLQLQTFRRPLRLWCSFDLCNCVIFGIFLSFFSFTAPAAVSLLHRVWACA